jgi:hypothetical protein
MTALAHYVRHAERHGTAAIYETALDDLGADDLATLDRRLRELDPRWRPPRPPAAEEATGAADQGVRQGPESRTRKRAENGAAEIRPVCRICGASLAGYREHARVCRRPSCRKRAQRARAEAVA